MPFPDLTLSTGRTNISQATGIPSNGVNEVAHNWNLQNFQLFADAVEVEAVALGPSISAVSYLGMTADKLKLRISFDQGGFDQCSITARHIYSAAM